MIEPRALYIDPAVGSYIIMSVASIAVPIGAVIVMMWRDIKSKFIKERHISSSAVPSAQCSHGSSHRLSLLSCEAPYHRASPKTDS